MASLKQMPYKQFPISGELFKEFSRLALIAFVYFIAVRIGILFAVKPEGIASIWFPSGVALAALLLNEKRKWAIVLLVIFLTNAAGNMAGGNTLPVSLCFALANSIEPALGAWVFSYFFKSKITFTNTKEVLVLCGIAVLGNGITALLGATVPMIFFKAPFFDTWFVWWVADGLGIIMITPIIITWATSPVSFKLLTLHRFVEMIVLLAVMLAFMYLLPYYGTEMHQYIQLYSIFPFLIWAALRFGQKGAATTIFIFSSIILWATIYGFNWSGLTTIDLKKSVLIIQILIIIITPTGLILAAIIAERKHAEEALKRIKKLLNETEKVGKAGGWEFDVDTGKQTWTEETYRIHEVDFTFDPTVEKGVTFYTPFSRAIIESAVKRTIEQGEPFDLELEIITAKDNLRSVHVIGKVDKENRRIYGFIQDITDRKQAEKERERLQKEILKSHKLESIGTLAGGIAHDFNNLLYVVMGNISLAQDDLNLQIETSENLKEAEKACIKAKELSAQLITFSKGGDPVKKRMPITGLLKDTVVSLLSGSNITPKISIADAIRNVNIDEGQIRHVIRNIVVNAKEAMGNNGQLTVSCENVDIAEKGYLTLNQGEYIKISFKDQGCGILKENLDKIFDPYFSTKEMGADKGQGLGLTVCYSIIQKHGGLIHVDSEPQTGSTFSVFLPAVSFKKPELQSLREKETAQEFSKKPVVGAKKILLMDDEEAIRTFMCRIINRLGYTVETCAEGKEAVEIYKKAMESKEPFDVVILDLTNKIGMGGQATMKRLLEINPDVKGIIITGYSDDPVVANFNEYGFSGFIIKPATRGELSKVISEAIS